MKKLSKKELVNIGFIESRDHSHLFLSMGCELEYNTKSGELFAINDGYGEPEFLCVTFDINILNDLRLQFDKIDLED